MRRQHRRPIPSSGERDDRLGIRARHRSQEARLYALAGNICDQQLFQPVALHAAISSESGV